MAKQTQSRGVCAHCGKETTKNTMARHLDNCPNRQEAMQLANTKGNFKESLLQLRVQAAYQSSYWLDLEMRGSAPLQELDEYLREIWLECCDHISEFIINTGYVKGEIKKTKSVNEAFFTAKKLTHLYDFGSTSETLISLAKVREGVPTTPYPIVLLSRNLPPHTQCMECDKEATHLCMECIIENDMSGALCDNHAKKHPHQNYGKPSEIVNSPRMGMCGYDGPAKPPY